MTKIPEGSGVGPVRLADGLGWASVALGLPMTTVPRRTLRAIGVEPDTEATRWLVGVGVREHLGAITILAMRHRRIGAWARVAGDTMDLTLLAAALRHRRGDAGRIARAAGVVATLLATDLAVAMALSRAEGAFVAEGSGSEGEGVDHDTSGGPTRVRTAVTIRKPEDEVRAAFREFGWSAFDPAELEASGEARFVPAPGDRGTEVHLDHEPGIRGGTLGAAAAKVAGASPDQLINDELRRFKALLETGVLVVSEKSPEGPSSRRQIFQKSAQPAGKEA